MRPAASLWSVPGVLTVVQCGVRAHAGLQPAGLLTAPCHPRTSLLPATRCVLT